MKRASVSFGSALAVLVIALPAAAVAPSDQYEGFIGEDDTITDHYTKLVWDRNLAEPYAPALMRFDEAKTVCETAKKRLPSLKELLTIVDEAPWMKYTIELKNEPRYIDKHAFESTPREPFWTSSDVVSGSDKVYTVNFSTGKVEDASKTLALGRVRCVQSL